MVSGVLDLVLDVILFYRGQCSAHGIDAVDVLAGLALNLIGELFDGITAPHRICHMRDAAFMRDDLLGPQRQTRRFLGGQRQRFILGVGVERLRPTQHGGQRLHRNAHHVHVRLLRGESGSSGLDVKAHHQGARITCTETIAHEGSVQPPRSAILCDLFQKIVVRVEEEGKARSKFIHLQTCPKCRLDVGDGVRQSEGHFLRRSGAGFANVIAADGNSVPFRQLARGPREEIGDNPHGRPRRVDIGSARDVFLEDVVLDSARELAQVGALAARHQHVEAQQNRRRRIDGHGRGDVRQSNAVEQTMHVVQSADGHAHPAHFTGRQIVIGIHPHLRGQIEGNRKSGDALRKKIAVTPVAFLGRPESGVLAHGPQPAAIHVGIYPSGVGVLAGELAWVGHDLEILRARQKDDIPNHPMISTNGMVKARCAPLPSLPKLRMAAGTGSTAKTRKKKPIT